MSHLAILSYLVVLSPYRLGSRFSAIVFVNMAHML